MVLPWGEYCASQSETSPLKVCERCQVRAVHADPVECAAVSIVHQFATREDNELAIRREAGGKLLVLSFMQKQMLIATIGIHQPKLGDLEVRIFVEDDLSAIRRPVLPVGSTISV
jgi:hypothetical protein